MFRMICIALVAASGVAGAVTGGPPPASADELIARNIAARGGMAQIQALTSLSRTGRLVIPGANLDITMKQVVQRGGKVRDELTFQGLTAVNAYDGAQAWKIDPFEGRKDPAKMSIDEAKPLVLEGDLDSPLSNYAAKGYTAEYLGVEDVEGSAAFKLRLRRESGDEVLYFIDPDSSMIIRAVQKFMVRGAEQETETDYGEYEPVAGVYFPMTEQSGRKNSSPAQKQQTVYEKASANDTLPADLFGFPAGK